MNAKGMFVILIAGTTVALATYAFEADAAGPLQAGSTSGLLLFLGLGLVGLGMWGRKKIFRRTPKV